MSEHSSKHVFVPCSCGCGCGHCITCLHAKYGTVRLADDPIHAQAEPMPLEIAGKWREWWNLCKEESTDNMYIRKNSLRAILEELSQAQQRIAELEQRITDLEWNEMLEFNGRIGPQC